MFWGSGSLGSSIKDLEHSYDLVVGGTTVQPADVIGAYWSYIHNHYMWQRNRHKEDAGFLHFIEVCLQTLWQTSNDRALRKVSQAQN